MRKCPIKKAENDPGSMSEDDALFWSYVAPGARPSCIYEESDNDESDSDGEDDGSDDMEEEGDDMNENDMYMNLDDLWIGLSKIYISMKYDFDCYICFLFNEFKTLVYE